MLGSASAAEAQIRDGVGGTVVVEGTPVGGAQLTFEATSGPSGEDPTGVVHLQLNGAYLDFNVNCLAVKGSAATVGATFFSGPLGQQDIYLQVVDGGPGNPDEIGVPATGSANVCANPPQSFLSTFNILSGDLVVEDAQPFPTSKNQCTNGGWRNYGTTFKNHGQCVGFVQRGAKPAP
jgi:hypothetical protein